jgi:neurotransmitter:Na+ symporter, NSS family
MGFVLAAAGGAVGLGNIWKFPYEVGANGGSAFLLVYLVLILFLGLPVLVAEVILGKATQRNPVGAFQELDGKNSPWQTIGFVGVLAAFIILSFYSVVAGWCFEFIWQGINGAYSPSASPEAVKQIFGELQASQPRQLGYHGVFMLITIGIVFAGVQSGLQRVCEILMPLLIIILIGLVIFAMNQPGAKEGVRFLLEPDFSKLTPKTILSAMGQCFFSLSLGMGAMLTYGSYLRKEDKVISAAGWVVTMDTGIALLAGFVIFPIVFTFGIDPGAGPGLVFVSLPAAFQQLAAGTIVGTAFFVLLLAAAITSAISLLEVITAYFVDEYQMSRRLASVMFGMLCFLIGVGCTFSGGYFNFLDKLASNYLLPLGALFISLFAGWSLKARIAESEFEHSKFAWAFGVWLFCVRFVAPVLVTLVFLNSIGLFEKSSPAS